MERYGGLQGIGSCCGITAQGYLIRKSFQEGWSGVREKWVSTLRSPFGASRWQERGGGEHTVTGTQ